MEKVGVGRIPTKINGTLAVFSSVEIKEDQNQKLTAVNTGDNIRTEGNPKFSFSFKGVITKGRQEILQALNAAKATGELTISYKLGDDGYLLANCGKNSLTWTSDSDGNSEFSLAGVAGEWLPVS